MYAGDRLLESYVFPWALVSLIVTGATALLWGVRPAVFVLLLSAVFSTFVVPAMHVSHFYDRDLSLRLRSARTLLLVASGALVVALARWARLMNRRAEQRKTVLETLHQAIVPAWLADIPGFDVAATYHPAFRDEYVGGDFYDVFPVKPQRFGILIGDVVGKGKAAALSTAMLRYCVRAFASLDMTPAQILRQTNRFIEGQEANFRSATLLVGILDACSGKIRIASAGHEPPMARRACGGIEVVKVDGLILGIDTDFPYTETEICLGPGDALLFLTDGVTESRDSQRRFLGSEGAAELLAACADTPTATASLARFESELLDYIGSGNRDDIALVLLVRHPSQQRSSQPVPR
jgi:serine phosphatase RsbU (regulator of sigma subunit)